MANSRAKRNTNRATHVAMIMDGNGRWAIARGLPRLIGHKNGVEAVRRIVRVCPDLGIKYLTLFAFSTENWRRSEAEVQGLMQLLRRYILKEVAVAAEKNIRLRFIGGTDRIAPGIQKMMRAAEEQTAGNDGLHLTIAIDYGGRDEIIRAQKAIAIKVASGEITPDQIDENMIAAHLDTADLPDPDLVIRTSGEKRISNFLLWQAAYAEYEFPDVNWPDFSPKHLKEALDSFAVRERRFGAVKS